MFGIIASLGAGFLSDMLNKEDPEENPDSKLVIASCLLSLPL